MVKSVMEDICKVTIDYKNDKTADTGLWKLIHKAPKIEQPNIPVGFSLLCEGVKVKVPTPNDF